MTSLGRMYELSFDDIDSARRQKKSNKGGFENRIYTEYVETDSDNEFIG
jgi:hypothetical protein